MKNVTTSETAKTLAENGFPQPTPEFGQVWYLSGKPHVCIGHEGGGIYNFRSQEGMEERTAVNYPTYFFAPTATDILEQLPGWAITKGGSMKVWSVWLPLFEPPESDEMEFHLRNPAEAGAEAWLKLNKK